MAENCSSPSSIHYQSASGSIDQVRKSVLVVVGNTENNLHIAELHALSCNILLLLGTSVLAFGINLNGGGACVSSQESVSACLSHLVGTEETGLYHGRVEDLAFAILKIGRSLSGARAHSVLSQELLLIHSLDDQYIESIGELLF